MKAWLILTLAAAVPLSSLAQSATNIPSRKTYTAQTTSGKSVKVARKVDTKHAAAEDETPARVREAAPLSAESLALADQVHVGRVACELGASVQVEADAKAPGYFHVRLNRHHFHMAPVPSATGALRLEDAQEGAVWLQLANKSMMMSTKHGKRLVDGCMSTAQEAVAVAMEKNPPPSLLDPVVPKVRPQGVLALHEQDD